MRVSATQCVTNLLHLLLVYDTPDTPCENQLGTRRRSFSVDALGKKGLNNNYEEGAKKLTCGQVKFCAFSDMHFIQ